MFLVCVLCGVVGVGGGSRSSVFTIKDQRELARKKKYLFM
jgi:hypothetical protein